MLEHTGAVIVTAVESAAHLDAFLTRYPLCAQRPVSWAHVAFRAFVAFHGTGIARHYDQEVLDSAALRRSLGLARNVHGGSLVLESCSDLMIVRDDFAHVLESFLHQLPLNLRAGSGLMFHDHYSSEGTRVTLADGVVEFDDLGGNVLRAPLREVLPALVDAKARFERIMALAAAEDGDDV